MRVLLYAVRSGFRDRLEQGVNRVDEWRAWRGIRKRAEQFAVVAAGGEKTPTADID